MKFENVLNIALASALAFAMGKKKVRSPMVVVKNKEENNDDDAYYVRIFPTMAPIEGILKDISFIMMQNEGHMTVADLAVAMDEKPRFGESHIGWSAKSWAPIVMPSVKRNGTIAGYILKIPQPQMLTKEK